MSIFGRREKSTTGLSAKKGLMTLCAESKGALHKGKAFSFGNAGREPRTGVIIPFNGMLRAISVSTKRTKLDEEIGVSILQNGKEGDCCVLTTEYLSYLARGMDRFGNSIFTYFAASYEITMPGYGMRTYEDALKNEAIGFYKTSYVPENLNNEKLHIKAGDLIEIVSYYNTRSAVSTIATVVIEVDEAFYNPNFIEKPDSFEVFEMWSNN